MPDLLSTVASSITDGVASVLGSMIPKLSKYLMDPKNRRIRSRLVWIICVVLLLIVSAAAIFGLKALLGSYQPGIGVTVVVWALFLGATASLMLSSKVIVATFGGLAGISLSEIGTGAGLISLLRNQIIAMAKEIAVTIDPGAPPPQTPDPFIYWMIWLFVGIVALLCLPAFFDKEARAERDAEPPAAPENPAGNDTPGGG